MANQRGYVHVEVEKNENKFVFLMPVGSKLGEAYDAAYDVLVAINEMGKNAADQAKPKKEDA